MDLYFFILGIVNSLLLILIFVIREHHLPLVRKYGWIYLLQVVPAILGIVYGFYTNARIEYMWFLILFLAFLIFEALLDHILKIDFRSSFKGKLLFISVPYLILYYIMNYGFIVMPWDVHLSWGIVMLVLFVIQIVLNIRSHKNQSSGSYKKGTIL